jgi:hypothetical protein
VRGHALERPDDIAREHEPHAREQRGTTDTSCESRPRRRRLGLAARRARQVDAQQQRGQPGYIGNPAVCDQRVGITGVVPVGAAVLELAQRETISRWHLTDRHQRKRHARALAQTRDLVDTEESPKDQRARGRNLVRAVRDGGGSDQRGAARGHRDAALPRVRLGVFE